MSALESFSRAFKDGFDDIAGMDSLSSAPTPKQQAIMNSWEDPRGPGYGKAALAAKKVEEAPRGPWHTRLGNVVVIASVVFVVGLMFGSILIF